MKKKAEAEKFDVIIIGGGAAGMSAALWCDELKLNALLLESKKELGGQLHIVHNPIENHLGATAKNGEELNRIFLKQIKNRKFEIRLNSEVTDVNFKTKTVDLVDGSKFSARAIVIATGVSRRKLNVDGEDKFQGRGILESGKRDAAKVKGKTVCVVGGGDAALENALILSETAAKVYLIHRGKEFRARPEFIERVNAAENIEIVLRASISEILGENRVEAVKYEISTKSEISCLAADAIIVRIGVAPNTELFQGKIKLDSGGYIEVNSECETDVANIFAIGDAANSIAPTISTAVGTGATVGKMLFKRLKNLQ